MLVAILLLLRYEESQPKTSDFEIVGITCSFGNAREDQVEQNVLKILTVAGRDDIPVYGGAKQGFVEPFSTDFFFGSDGFGDFEFGQRITAKLDRSKHAAVALVDLAREYAGEVSVLSLGPTTNIALAIALDGDFTKNVNHFYVMGGSVHGIGNTKTNVEFNFGADPEGNLLLFNATEESQIKLFPFETVLKTGVSKDWRFNVFGKCDSPYVKFLNKVESIVMKKGGNIWRLSDPLMAACVIDKLLVTAHVVRNVDPVTDGKARGTVLVDHAMTTDKVRNSFIIESVNKTRYQDILIRYLTCEQIYC